MNYIFINDNDMTYTYKIKNFNDTIESVIKYLCKRTKTNRNNFWLSYANKIMLPHFKINDYIHGDSTLILNWRPLNMIDIKSGNKIYTIDLFMLNDSEIFFDKKSHKIYKLNNFYIMPKKYLDDETHNLWYSLYNIKKKYNIEVIEKPISDNILNIMHIEYYNFLSKCTYNQIIKLGKLFNYLKIDKFFNLICAFIAYEYLRCD